MKRLFVIAALLAAAMSPAGADEPSTVTLDDKEKAFVELMNNAVLVGNFTVNRKRLDNDANQESAKQSPERYGIRSIQKTGDGRWLVHSHIKYGKLDVTVPVPVQVHFANDTPVLSVTNLTIPLVGSEFTARVMFYDDQYAGTWRHGKVGGLMYGRIEKATPAEPSSPDAAPKEGDQKSPPAKAAPAPAAPKE